ncbi:rho guanine nucleotide exchange factor 17 [Tachyglossus aculeatus]|uniref:rho guanine nucleotide exchange factor 17 n=1 Tax=Tachyglossus aculeatus TaxID=9261 RepID=UPI0018F5B383|nr:rho guanine nucleotide exchange factor 17 [Tachyglossus aculeatus]
MEDGAPRARAPLYRSVSFKRLERWSGGPTAAGAGGGAREEPPPRGVSKLSSTPQRGPLSPSVRRLSQRFDASRRPDPRPDGEDEPPPPPPPEGPRGDPPPGDPEDGPAGGPRGAGPEPGGLWPSVTEMRKLFGGESPARRGRAREPGGAAPGPGPREDDGPGGGAGRQRRQQRRRRRDAPDRPDRADGRRDAGRPRSARRRRKEERARPSRRSDSDGLSPAGPEPPGRARRGGARDPDPGDAASGPPPRRPGRTLADGGAFPRGCGAALPAVSRVSRVTIPPLLPGPGPGPARPGARPSSAETPRDGEPDGAGPACLRRSPSCGFDDGPLRAQPQPQPRPQAAAGLLAPRATAPKQRKSLSNPDIASETLSLLNFLRADLSELRIGRRGGGRPGPPSGRTSPLPVGPGRAGPGGRPSLKDLTATLRRAKSFTYPDAPAPRRLRPQSGLQPGTYELLLDGAGLRPENPGDRGDDDDNDDDGLPLPVPDQYVQEAQQVFENIHRMGLAAAPDEAGPLGGLQPTVAAASSARGLPDRGPGPQVPHRRSLDELSGHESSLTDEGIVTEPEMPPPAQGADKGLGPAGAWRAGGATLGDRHRSPVISLESAGGGPEPPDPPSTPGALRQRRRKGPSAGLVGPVGGPGEPLRSLSDPMPHRGDPAARLLDSLEATAASAGAAGDPNGPQAPTARQGARSTAKKKSLSDPSRRGELVGAGVRALGAPIREVDPGAPTPSGEAALDEGPSPGAAPHGVRRRSVGLCPPQRELGPGPCRAPPPPPNRHVRHASEPAFVPLAAPAPATEPSGRPRAPAAAHPPSLEAVTQRYMMALGSRDSPPVCPPGPVEDPRPPPPHAAPISAGPSPAASKIQGKPRVDMRKHVIMTLLDTEQSYVESLRTLMQVYMKPLKQPENSILVDPSLVDEIFDQIPELLEHHEQFLEQVHQCVQNWHEKQKVGDLLVQSFSKDILVNIYSAYIDNFLNAKDAVRIAKEARPAFLKFLEQSMRENKEKQALSDLMIKPVQRIPRYELLVKDLLKHTPEDHPDHPFLIDAQRNIKQVAERINQGMKNAEEVERNARIVQEIEAHIEGMEDLQAPLRRFLRQEMVVEAKAVGGKKDRSLFLFSDLLVCTTLKRKSGSLRRSSVSLYTAASVIDTTSKYKLLWKLPLEDLDIVKGASQATNRESIQKAVSRLDEDLATLGHVSKLSESLSFPHQGLDDAIKELTGAVHRELAEKQALALVLSSPPSKVELAASKPDGSETFTFEFPSTDACHGFEVAFEDTKRKLASHRNCQDPEFLKAIPIMKTRSGMQFSCASPSHSSSPDSAHEVWVCNSDGYVGQVCLLSIRQEPTVEACIAVCSARILCIASVPGLKRSFRERPESSGGAAPEPPAPPAEEADAQQCLHISISGSSLELPEPVGSAAREPMPFDSDDTDDESSPSPSGTLQSQASRSTISSSFGNEEMATSKDAAAETTSSEEEQEPSFLPLSSSFGQSRGGGSPVDGRAVRRSSRGSFTRGSLEDLLTADPEAFQSSVWLGTEDGCIHVYQSSDNIRNRKNSLKLQHGAAVTCILYLGDQVFVSLASGDLVVYRREAARFWDPQNCKSLPLGSAGNPITKMVAVSGRLWCGCQNTVLVLGAATLAQEHQFQVGPDSHRSVTCLVSSSVGVWVTLQGSAQVRLYHATSYEQLAEVDVSPPVHKMLAGSDAIIRQHKAACLRITALLACQDLLWIGTSAGVVLTLPLAAPTPGAPRPAPPLTPVGLSQGHTGHVRFLTALELPDGSDLLLPPPLRDTGPVTPCLLERREPARPRLAPSPLPLSKAHMLVISGGDGYEDFRLASGAGGGGGGGSSSETVGRDDSTNHLLLWRV